MFSYPIDVEGTTTRVLQSGHKGDAIILLHGTGARADRWASNIDALAGETRRVFAFDLPGHGFADKSADFPHSVRGYADFLGAFMRAEGLDSATLVGTSLGGHVAGDFAARYPDKVDALVLVGAMGLVPIGEEARLRIQKGATSLSREAVAQKFTRVILDQTLVTASLVEEEYRINNSAGAAACFDKLGAYIADRLDDDIVGAAVGRLPEDIPVLLVWGREDKTVPLTVGERAQALIPRAPLAILDGAAHTSYLERPEAFNALIADFLAGKIGARTIEGLTIV